MTRIVWITRSVSVVGRCAGAMIVGREEFISVLKMFRNGQVEHEWIRGYAHVKRLIEQNARDRLERMKVVDLQIPLAIAKLDHKQLVHIDHVRLRTEQVVNEVV